MGDKKQVEFKASAEEQGVFAGYASVYGIEDLDGDIVEPGAFADSIATGAASEGVLIFAQHQDQKEPLGRSLELREDEKGLYVRGQISDTSRGRDYRQLVKDGVLNRMSIGYIATQYHMDERNIRHITKAELLEISIVNYPANTEARIENYKGGATMKENIQNTAPNDQKK